MTDELSQRRLLALAVKCPYCGHAPRLRISHVLHSAVAGFNPKATALTYACHERTCRKAYEVPFRAFQQPLPEKLDRAA